MFRGAVFVLCLLFLVRSSRTIDPDLLPRFVVLAGAVAVLLFLLVAVLFKQEGLCPVSEAGSRAVAFWLAYVAVVGASSLVAVNRSEALFQWEKSAVLFLFFVAFAWLLSQDEARVETVAAVLSMIGLVLALVGVSQLVQLFRTCGWNLDTSYEVHGLSGARNLYSQVLLLTLPFGVYVAALRRRLWRAGAALAAVLSPLVIIALMARSAWIGLLVASVATAALGVWRAWSRPEGPLVLRRWVLGGAAALVLSAALGLGISGTRVRSVLASRAVSILHPNEGTAVPRLFLWSRTVEMVRDHPLLGVGAGNWKLVFPKYGRGGRLMRNAGRMPQRPHNDPLWVLSETGIVGFSIYLAFMGTFLLWTAHLAVAEENRSTAALAAALFFSQVAYLAVSLFSFPAERMEHGAVMAVVLAMSLALHQRDAPDPRRVGRTVAMTLAASGAVVALGAFGTGLVRMKGEVHVKRAYRALQLEQLREAVREIDRAESPVYTVDRGGFPLCLYRALALTELGEAERAHRDLVLAQRESPYNVVVLDCLAWSFFGRGDQAQAVRLWNEALDMHPGYSPSVRGLAMVTPASPRR